MEILTYKDIENFKNYLINEEKSNATIEKYIRDVKTFLNWLDKRELEKSTVLDYKNIIISNYKPRTVNSIISSINCFFSYIGKPELKVKMLKLQSEIFISEEKELSRSEYERLLKTAQKNNERLCMIMQTICASGIRISELQFITTDAIKKGYAEIKCKGKQRTVVLAKELCKVLIKYCSKRKIEKGPIFVSKKGKPIDRSNIWTQMKKLCDEAKVSKTKVFPHNLRHLFAKTFYSLKKDIVRLANILGHTSINTTRIYTMESAQFHLKQIEQLGFVYMKA